MDYFSNDFKGYFKKWTLNLLIPREEKKIFLVRLSDNLFKMAEINGN